MRRISTVSEPEREGKSYVGKSTEKGGLMATEKMLEAGFVALLTRHCMELQPHADVPKIVCDVLEAIEAAAWQDIGDGRKRHIVSVAERRISHADRLLDRWALVRFGAC